MWQKYVGKCTNSPEALEGHYICKTKWNKLPNNKSWKTSERIPIYFWCLTCVAHADDDILCHLKTKNVCPAKLYSRLWHGYGHLHGVGIFILWMWLKHHGALQCDCEVKGLISATTSFLRFPFLYLASCFVFPIDDIHLQAQKVHLF